MGISKISVAGSSPAVPAKKKGVIAPFLIRGESTLIKENRIILEKPLGFLIILTSSNSKSEKNEEMKSSGEIGNLFCRKCRELLSPPDKESGLRRCDKCGENRRTKGKRRIIISKAKPYKERKTGEEDFAR